MHATWFILFGLLTQVVPATTSTSADEIPAPHDVVVAVCPEDFRPALAPWVDYRTGQGYDVRLVSSRGTPEEIRGRIRAAAPAERLKFLVLVGDLPTAMDGEPVVGLDADRCVPAPYAKAKVNIAWGSEPKIPDDAWYADLDDDRLPDVAQGRLTADTPEELAAMVQKILSYERSTDFRPWRRRMNFVAGVGGFGAMADSVIESATRYLLTTNLPADYDVMMTQANWRAVYCPDPRRIDRTTIDRLNDGAMFWTYIGHANPLRLAAMRVPGGRYPLLSTRDAERLQADRGPSIALFLCCYAGAIDSRPDCLAEALVRQPGGPVAAVASSRVAMPYAMAVMCREMMDACFKQRAATLGEAVLTAKRSLVHPAEENETRTMLDSIGSLVSPSKSLADERTEHVTLFNLIGDPCLRLRWPRPVTVAVVPDAADRAKLVVEGDSPIAGRALVELVRPLGQLGFRPPRRTKYPDSPEALDAYELTYQRANDRRISEAELRVGPGPFRAELTPPGDLAGKYLVRVFVEGTDEFASGSTDVRLGEEKG